MCIAPNAEAKLHWRIILGDGSANIGPLCQRGWQVETMKEKAHPMVRNRMAEFELLRKFLSVS